VPHRISRSRRFPITDYLRNDLLCESYSAVELEVISSFLPGVWSGSRRFADRLQWRTSP
jgi:hypothetical protein